jgi:transposase
VVVGALAKPKKGALNEGRTVIWVDESGFYLLPALVRSLAPRGPSANPTFPLTRDHLSVISGITPGGRLLLQVQDHAFRSPEVVLFLRHLLRQVPGKLLVLWDGAPIHRAQVIKDFLKRKAAKRLHLERLPGYAPELNPQEGVWNLLKRKELKNICCQDVAQVAEELRHAKERWRHRRAVLKQCFAHAGCPV